MAREKKKSKQSNRCYGLRYTREHLKFLCKYTRKFKFNRASASSSAEFFGQIFALYSCSQNRLCVKISDVEYPENVMFFNVDFTLVKTEYNNHIEIFCFRVRIYTILKIYKVRNLDVSQNTLLYSLNCWKKKRKKNRKHFFLSENHKTFTFYCFTIISFKQ